MLKVAYAFHPFPAYYKPSCDATLPATSTWNNGFGSHPLLTSPSAPLTTVIHVNGVPYTVVRPLGEGLHSRVYAARDARTGQSVAIKVVQNLDSMTSRQHTQMFFKEIRYLTKLQSRNPYVIRVYNHDFDYNTQTGKIVMETGHDFRFMLPLQASSDEKKMTPSKVKHYWRQMVESVALLHRHGIVHSDIKPENFVLTSEGQLRIIDLGLSFRLPHTQASVLRPFAGADSSIESLGVQSFCTGTPEYMPPEVCQIQHGQYSRQGRASDIWALGVLLFEMTFGYRPFEHVQDNYEKMSHIAQLTQNPTIPSSNHSQLREVLQQCLQINPSSRPNAEELLQHSFFH